MIRELTDMELDAVCGGWGNFQSIAFVSQTAKGYAGWRERTDLLVSTTTNTLVRARRSRINN